MVQKIKEYLKSIISLKQYDSITMAKKIAIENSAKYILNNIQSAALMENKDKLFNYAIELAKKRRAGSLILEFGVFKGRSLNILSVNFPNYKIYGFDIFTGIPDAMYGTNITSGHFKTIVPDINKNCELIVGDIKDTVVDFSKTSNEKILFMNIDCDNYEPTKNVLYALKNHLTTGSIIFFDEYLGYPGWENGEFKAFQEFVKDHQVKYKYLGFSVNEAIVEIQ